jgi:hypothetical protein
MKKMFYKIDFLDVYLNFEGRHDTQHNDTLPNKIQHKELILNHWAYIRPSINDTQHKR